MTHNIKDITGTVKVGDVKCSVKDDVVGVKPTLSASATTVSVGDTVTFTTNGKEIFVKSADYSHYGSPEEDANGNHVFTKTFNTAGKYNVIAENADEVKSDEITIVVEVAAGECVDSDFPGNTKPICEK